MNVAQTVLQRVNAIPAGQIFGYQQLPSYAQSPSAVVKAVNRLVAENRLSRFSKGKFYVPKKGFLGKAKPSDTEMLRSMLYKDGRLRGYVTGLSLYNQLGLTTQMPRTITLAINGARQKKELGTIRVKTIATRAPVTPDNLTLLQYLDVLKDIRLIPDSDINRLLETMSVKISALSSGQQKALSSLALEYYAPQGRALLGLLFAHLEISFFKALKLSLNPTTTYKLNLDENAWPNAKEWNIR